MDHLKIDCFKFDHLARHAALASSQKPQQLPQTRFPDCVSAPL